MEEAQAQLPQVECAGDELVNAFYFKYLGSIFAADGDHKYDVRRRIGIAMTRMGQLRHVFSSKLPRSLKLKVYKAAICSLFTYGSEAWNLDEQTCAALNGANSRCLSRFTGRTIHEEASPRTRTFDLVAAIRQTRARWLGHILRMGPERMLHQAALQQFKNGSAGNLFMDVPAHLSLDRIKTIAQDRAMWKKLMVYSIRHHVSPPRQDATRQHSGASSTTNMTTRSASRAITSARPNRSTTTPTPGHETSLTPAVKPMRLAQAKVKRKKKKPKGLTDKQRAVEAHAHYIIHHSTAADAARFLRNNGNIKNASIETITALRQMCPTTPAVPTWEAADAAVFSSSSDESADMNSGESHAAVAAIAPVWSESAAAPDTVQATHDMHRRLQRLDGSESKLTSAAAVSTVPTWGQTIAIETHNDNNDSQHDDVEMRTPAHNADDKHMPLTVETKLENTEARRYRTRSTTAKTRANAAAVADAANSTCPSPPASKRKPKRRRAAPAPCARPKQVKVAPSQIPGAGMGLYLLEDAKTGEWIARYSGDPLTWAESNRRKHSHYRLQVHRNLFLDAEDTKHFEGRYINDARRSKHKVNARFAANYATNTCSETGHKWVRIYATRRIKAGEEIFLDYGEEFWQDLQQCLISDLPTTTMTRANPSASPSTTPPPPSINTTTSKSSSSLWAAPAMIQEDDTPEHGHITRGNLHMTPSATTSSVNASIWAKPARMPTPGVHASPATTPISQTTPLDHTFTAWDDVQVETQLSPTSPTTIHGHHTLITDNTHTVIHIPLTLSPITTYTTDTQLNDTLIPITQTLFL